MKYLWKPLLGAFVAVAVVSTAAVEAQTAREIVDAALDRHEEQTRGIDDYTVVQEIMGMETTTHYERVTREGRSVFVPREGAALGEDAPEDPFTLLKLMGERAEYAGTEDVDGLESHVLVLTDFEDDVFDAFWPPEEEGEWTPEEARFYLDTEELAFRKIVLEGSVTRNDVTRSGTMTMWMRDYRDVEGLYYPFRTDFALEGLAPEISPEEERDIRMALEELEEELAGMPEAQREQLEQMMGGQLERMEEMLAGGTMEVTIRVKEIRVNEGPPDG